MKNARRADVDGLDDLLAPEGWPYASSPPQGAGDPGRYHALFGRDALITSLAVLPARPDVARATLRALASLQGRADDPQTEEEPGKIPHEHWPRAPRRLDEMGFPVRDGRLLHYGTADATAWFCVVLDMVGDRDLVEKLDGAWRRAGDWLEDALDRGGGLVRHQRRGSGGLTQMGWRDAVDPVGGDGGGIVRADGTAPVPPLADADTQAVAHVALRALARLSGERRFEARARALADLVAASYVPDVMALEGDDRPVRGAGSQLGWLLWSGALDDHPRALTAVADRLCRPDVLTPFGLRTLSSEHPAFRVDGYHRGSVWPFDSWLGWSGLRACGRVAEAERVRDGVLGALARIGSAVELYGVDAAGDLRPVAIANRVQAWTVGARFALRTGWDARLPR